MMRPISRRDRAWAYDNSGYVLIGAVIEAVSGKSWHAYLQRYVFRHRSASRIPPIPATLVAAHVRGYTLTDGKAVPAGALPVHADGALVSTVDDLLTWNRALHKGHVLQDDELSPHDDARRRGLFRAIWFCTLEHDAAQSSDARLIAATSRVSARTCSICRRVSECCVLQNMDRGASFADPSLTARKVAAFAMGDPFPVPTPIKVDATALTAAQGVYGSDPPGPRDGSVQSARLLRVIDGKLTMSRPGDLRSNLIPIGVDAFQSADSLDRLQIERASGTISGIRLFSNGEGKGVILARTDQVVQAVPAFVTLSRSELDRIVGNYATEGVELRMFLDGEHLRGQMSGQRAFDVKAESPTRFFLMDIDATLDFSPPDVAATHLTIHQGGETVELTRRP